MIYHPRFSWVFVGLAGISLVAAYLTAAQYWKGPPWNPQTVTGNIMYHDITNFGFALWFISIASGCGAVFLIKHGPF